MTRTRRPDETEPGGRYHNQDGTRWTDANGRDLGPVIRSETDDATTERITEGAAPAKADDDATENDAAKPAKAMAAGIESDIPEKSIDARLRDGTTRRATTAAKATKGR